MKQRNEKPKLQKQTNRQILWMVVWDVQTTIDEVQDFIDYHVPPENPSKGTL